MISAPPTSPNGRGLKPGAGAPGAAGLPGLHRLPRTVGDCILSTDALPRRYETELRPLQMFCWIRVGDDYRYQPRPGTGLDDRRSESCTVRIIARRNPRNCLVEFADGYQVVCSWGVLGKLR